MNSYLEHQAGWASITQGLKGDALTGVFRELCRRDLYFLLRVGCGREDMDNQWLYERCLEVQSHPDGYLDLWSREHYKSTIITFGKTLQDILVSHGDGATEREVTVGIFSHTRPIAKDFLKQLKREFEGNEKLKAWFPDILYSSPQREAPKWSDDEGLILKRKSNPRECTIEAWGVVDGQPIGKHFSLMVYDDIVTRDSVNTPEMIAKSLEMLELSYNLGAQGGRRRFIGTRYHFNDPYATLMDRGTAVARVKPATDDGTPTGNPVFWSPELLAEKRRDMGPYNFSCQILQNPVADENQNFKREWMRYHDGLDENACKRMTVYILVDPANSKRKGSDYTSIWVVGLGTDGNYYVIDMIRDRLNLTQRTKMVMELHRKFQPVRRGGVRYEKYAMNADIEHLNTMMVQENYRFEITPVGGLTSKIERISRLLPIFETGRFYFPRTSWYTQYDGKTVDLVKIFIEEEFTCFPVPRHDDMLDSLARIAEPDLPLSWPKKSNVYSANFGGAYANSDYPIFG